MEQSHDLTLTKDLKNTGNITQMGYSRRRRGMSCRKDFDTRNPLPLNLLQFINILNRRSHIDRKVGIRTTCISLDLLLYTLHRGCWWSRVGHIEDGGISSGQGGLCAMRDIFFVL